MPGPQDLITAGLDAAGLFTKAYGIFGEVSVAKQEAEASREYAAIQTQQETQKAALELDLNQNRRQAMETQARRLQLQNLREVQQKYSLARAAAVNQGAQFGSGAAGGKAQVAAEGAFNTQGLSNSLELGRNAFNLNQSLSANEMYSAITQQQYKTSQAVLEGNAATYKGYEQLGQSLMGAGGSAGKLFSGFGTGA